VGLEVIVARDGNCLFRNVPSIVAFVTIQNKVWLLNNASEILQDINGKKVNSMVVMREPG
jgi:hypothetical protein